jgi:hypothetical protein
MRGSLVRLLQWLYLALSLPAATSFRRPTQVAGDGGEKRSTIARATSSEASS